MSYSAFVICNCYKEGKTTEPPYNEYVRESDEGIYLCILDGLWEKDEELIYKMDKEFDEWKRSACEHEDMNAASEYLSNMSGMASFKRIIRRLGGNDKFPILTEYLPTNNGGTLPIEFAHEMHQELRKIENEATLEELVLLEEKSTGELKASVNSDTYIIFVVTAFNKNGYGIDKDGFFILENVKVNNKDVSNVMFRSINFLQQTISKDIYRFIDITTGRSIECSAKLHPDEENPLIDFEFMVTKKKVTIADEYEYIIEPLKKLVAASLQTGNPIIWT